jgi:hypothetical protein
MPVSVIFENLEYGATLEEIVENYGITREQTQAVLNFAAQSAAPPSVSVGGDSLSDAHPLCQKRSPWPRTPSLTM